MSAESEPAEVAVHPDGTRVCSVADALDLIGDRWSLLVVREVEFGVVRFNEIQRLTGAPRQVLTARLNKLIDVGVLVREQYSERPARFEYHLAPAGIALFPIIRELRRWGEEFVGSSQQVAAG